MCPLYCVHKRILSLDLGLAEVPGVGRADSRGSQVGRGGCMQVRWLVASH